MMGLQLRQDRAVDQRLGGMQEEVTSRKHAEGEAGPSVAAPCSEILLRGERVVDASQRGNGNIQGRLYNVLVGL
jgi:hypothetical protein